MKRPIITDLKILKQKSDQINDFIELRDILKDLEDSLDLSRGIGLAGIQIGITKNVAIIRIGEVKINLINAEIVEKSNKVRVPQEGCLSIIGIKVDTLRYNNITIINNGRREYFNGLVAIAIQHELDHCRGLTILDRKWRAR